EDILRRDGALVPETVEKAVKLVGPRARRRRALPWPLYPCDDKQSAEPTDGADALFLLDPSTDVEDDETS
ncbi:hypothetical protein THAOC_24864, partial [Thalassiosira oceanica]